MPLFSNFSAPGTFNFCRPLPVATKIVLVSKLFGRIFDFIYVDGNHCYADFNMDLKSWYPLVKVGGVFGGHDYTQVKDALVNFFRDKPENYEVRELDWWIIKEE